jgi:hypothetical protein
METLFRLVLTRPAVAQDDNNPSIPLAQDTAFQAALGQAGQSDDKRDAFKRVALQYVGSNLFIGDPKKLPQGDKLIALGAALDTFEAKESLSNNEMIAAVEAAFGNTPSELAGDNSIGASISSLKDSLIAIKQLPEEHSRPIEALTRQLRDFEVILKTASDDDFPGTGASLKRYRKRSLQLPTAMELSSALSTLTKQKELEKQQQEEEEKQKKEADGKLLLYKGLTNAVAELTKLDKDHLQVTPQKSDGGFLVPAQFRPTQLVMQELTQREQVSKLNLLRLQSVAIKEIADTKVIKEEAPATSISSKQPLSLFIGGKGPFTPLAEGETAFRMKSSAERVLSAETLQILNARGLSVTVNPIDTIVAKLNDEIIGLGKELDKLYGSPVQRSFKRIGSTLVMTSTPLESVWNSYIVSADLPSKGFPFPVQSIPTSHGSVAPVGVADLLVVKQQLVRYEGAEVAHIENVLKGEKKDREHSTRHETIEFNLTESETTTTEERELESTSRFEMSRESSQTIKEDASLKAGLNISGKYGPTVEFSASAEGSVSRSKEEATKSAASFSQDVTERSANKVTERVLQRSSLQTTNEVIEKNTHTLDNVGGTGHISGVYQWVNKVYQAQIFNYGMRVMYDFMVPEPAAFLISSLQSAHANSVELEKPLAFTLRPDQINETNYHSWVVRYQATDVQPPPEPYKTKALDFKGGGGDSDADYNHSGQITIDEGYRAIFGVVGIAGNVWENNAVIDVVLGSKTHRFSDGPGVGAWTVTLSDETDSIPFALDTWKYSQIAAAVEVKCQRTDRAILKWRLETHAKLTTAYKARLSEYEEKLAALEVQAGVAIRGRNPLLNMELMKDELKKHCITILTEQHFDLFDSVQTGAYNVPQINLTENAAEGPYVRFFEQAFEWEQMTWLTYPYFWGRKSQWQERIAYEDVDTVFNQFLKAGYCRVVVPVRPGFAGAVDHFETYGEIWNGLALPTISNPLYLPIADEIAERLDRPGDEIPQGDPWLVRIPTTLIKLRPDDKLPRWKQDADGEWIEE